MEILFYRYNSICEPDIIRCFEGMGLTVTEEKTQIIKKDTTPSQTVEVVGKLLQEHRFLFVFSINFFPALSEVCRIFKTPYVCWTVDAPVQELFSPSLSNDCNRIFYFDRAQYLYFRDRNPEHSFHLPLATNVSRWDKVIAGASETQRRKYACDISMVGSLYSEKNAYRKVKGLDEYHKGYIRGLVEAQLQVYGVNFIESMITDDLMKALDPIIPDLHQPLCEGDPDSQRYLIAHSFIGSELAEVERLRLLKALSEEFDVDLYSFSDASELPKIRLHPEGAKTLTEMPLIFHESRINLNITIRPIQTGLSLRNFDVCGCGGFLMCNWQEELPEMYEPGVEVETFASTEELLDKTEYYLSHEEERSRVARAGYERTVAEHTYEKRIAEMIRLINSTL